jgi:hypothetical protein
MKYILTRYSIYLKEYIKPIAKKDLNIILELPDEFLLKLKTNAFIDYHYPREYLFMFIESSQDDINFLSCNNHRINVLAKKCNYYFHICKYSDFYENSII